MFATALLLLQATIQSPRLIESSGVAVSRAYPDVLWSHNDSGDGPYLYATDLQGADRGRLLVAGAGAIDWEDMTLGPCPVSFVLQPRPTRQIAKSCVYLADTGDNLEIRPFVTVYAIPEPEPPTGPGDTLGTTRAAAVLTLLYPDGPHDVEGVYVSPRDTALYLVSKGYQRGAAIRVYRVGRQAWSPQDSTRQVAEATLVQTLDIKPNREAGRVVTGAAVRPDGRLVVLRTYGDIYLFYPGVGGRLAPARDHSCGIAGIDTGGEAIDFLSDSTFVLTSEASRGRRGTINVVKCGF
ncbi:MAG TPA: hypothetical protein VN803_01935 [Gemmatimonadales bacterium]|nr:hypothetical protein [Gemmatimonadales bacterium]